MGTLDTHIRRMKPGHSLHTPTKLTQNGTEQLKPWPSQKKKMQVTSSSIPVTATVFTV